MPPWYAAHRRALGPVQAMDREAPRLTGERALENHEEHHLLGLVFASRPHLARDFIAPQAFATHDRHESPAFDKLTTPTPLQQRALDLLGVSLDV